MSEKICVGIDVSKAMLEVGATLQECWAYANEEAGVQELLEALCTREVERIVLEASGGDEAAVAAALASAGLPVVVVNPRQVRDFAKATGRPPALRATSPQGEAILSSPPGEVIPSPLPWEPLQRIAAPARPCAHGIRTSVCSRGRPKRG